MAIDPLTGLPSSNTQRVYAGDKPISPVIEATKIGTTPNLVVPPPVSVPATTYTAPITETASGVQASVNTQQAQQEADRRMQEQLARSSDIATLQSQLGGQAQERANLYQSAGVNTAFNQLQDINAQLVALSNSNQAIPIQNQLAYQGTAGTQAGVQSVNRDQLAQNALKALSLGQQAAVAEGNFNKAKNLADQQVDVKYAQIKADIESRQYQLEALDKYVLTPAQEKAKQALARQYKKEDEEAERKIADEKAIQNMIIDATPNAPESVISNARRIAEKGGSKLAVAQALGVYGGDYLKNELLKQQIATEKAQKAKYYADIDKIRSEMNTKGLPATTANLAKVEASQSTYDLARELKTLEGKGGAVGFGLKKTVFAKIPGVDETPIAGTDRANYEAKFKQLKDTLASANLDKLKGAMSDKDIEFLRNIGTALSLDMSEEAFDKELDKVANTMSKVPGVSTVSSADNYLNFIDTSYNQPINTAESYINSLYGK